MPQSVISILKEDHREVDELFERMEAASDRALKMKQKLFAQINEALSAHAAAEEQILYPRMRELRPLRHNSFEAVEEHRLVKQMLAEIGRLEVGDEQWNAKVKVLIDLVRHHVKEEEGEYFKILKAKLDKEELRQLGQRIQEFKEGFNMQEAAPGPSRAGDGMYRSAANPSASLAASDTPPLAT